MPYGVGAGGVGFGRVGGGTCGQNPSGPNSIGQSNGAFQESWERSSRGILLKFGDSFLDLLRLLFGGIQI
jgi:hypothetical protein